MPSGMRAFAKVRMLSDEFVYGRPRERYQLRTAGRGRVLDVCRRMADRVEEAVDLVVAQGRTVLVGSQLRSQRKIRQLPVNAGDAAGPDGDEPLLWNSRTSSRKEGCSRENAGVTSHETPHK